MIDKQKSCCGKRECICSHCASTREKCCMSHLEVDCPNINEKECPDFRPIDVPVSMKSKSNP